MAGSVIMSRAVPYLATLALLAGAQGARADAIDGNWCAPDGRVLSIEGPQIVTPRGSAISGDYARHFFAYTVPAGEPDAGARVDMTLLDETTVRLDAGKGPEIWRRCDVTS